MKRTFILCYQWEIVGHPLNSKHTFELEDRNYSSGELAEIFIKWLSKERRGKLALINFWEI